MFSALRKLTGRGADGPLTPTSPPGGVQAMAASLQRRFARGVQYNSMFYNIVCFRYVVCLV